MAELEHPVDPQRVEAVRTKGLPAAEAEHLAALLTLLADPLRARLITALLAVDEMCVQDWSVAAARAAGYECAGHSFRLVPTDDRSEPSVQVNARNRLVRRALQHRLVPFERRVVR